MLHASLLPGIVLAPADPHSWAKPFCPLLWTSPVMCIWPLGLQPFCFPSNHCSCWCLVPSQTIPCLLCHLPCCCISHGTATSSLQSHLQTLRPPCSSEHYRGVTNWTLSRATCESHGTQWWSSSSYVSGGHSTIQVNKKWCANITHSNAVTDLQVK